MSYRWWLGRGRTQVGVGVGTLGYVMEPFVGRRSNAQAVTGSVPMMTVGWRYNVSNFSAVYADASRAQALSREAMAAQYNTQVGVEWQTKKSHLGLDSGRFALQLDSGYRMSLKVRRNGLSVMVRGDF